MKKKLFDFSDDAGTDEGGETEDFSFDDTEMSMDDDGGEEIEGSMDVEVTDDEDATKAVQKLTGKLGQKLRDLPETDMDADIIKYVLNSIISAVDLEKLSEEDKEEMVDKFEDEDIEYTEEGEFDVDLGGEEELDLDGGDFDLGGEEEIDLETELSEGWGALGRAAATGFGAMVADKATRRMGMDEEEEIYETSNLDLGTIKMLLEMAIKDPKLTMKVIDATLECLEFGQIMDLIEVIDWVNGRPEHCGKVMNIITDKNCRLDFTEYLTKDNVEGGLCLLKKVGPEILPDMLGIPSTSGGRISVPGYTGGMSGVDFLNEDEEEDTLSAQEELSLSEMSTQRNMDEMFEGEHEPLNKVLKMAMDNDELAKKFIDAVLGCANLQQLQDLIEVITWVKARPDYCGKVMNIVQDKKCVLDLTEYLTSDNFNGMACLLRKVGGSVFTNMMDNAGELMGKGMDTVTGMFDLDEEDMLQVPENPELSDEAAEAVADVFDMFESKSKVGKTLSSYFDYTKEEKRKIQENKERRSFDLHLAKNELLESVLKKAKTNKRIKNSFSSYEQERTTTKFLNENKNVRFVGKNKKGSLIFKGKNNLVEINTRGRIS